MTDQVAHAGEGSAARQATMTSAAPMASVRSGRLRDRARPGPTDMPRVAFTSHLHRFLDAPPHQVDRTTLLDAVSDDTELFVLQALSGG